MRVILITSGSVLLLTFASFFIYEYASYRQFMLRQTSTLGAIIARNSTAALAFTDQDEANDILSALKAEEGIVAGCLYDKDGKIFAVYPPGEPSQTFPKYISALQYRYSDGYLEGFQAVQQGGQRLGTLYLKASMVEMRRRVATYSGVALAVTVLGFALAFVLSRQLQRNITIPIVSLAITSRMISERHDYSVRAKKLSHDEIGLLTDAFNQMLIQIERQNREIVKARESLKEYAELLEARVNERTQQYREQRDFIETVLESSVESIIVYDRDTTILRVNRKFEELYRLRKEDIIGKKLLNVFPGATTGMDQFNRAVAGETIHTSYHHVSIVNKVFESFYIPLRNQKNEVYAVLVSAHDITEVVEAGEILKASAEQLQLANEELKRKNNELEQFAYVASHDLQEPLRKIQTFIELAKRSYADEPSAKRYMDKIEISAARMSSLIRDVLDYSRLGQPMETIEIVDLNTVLENVVLDFELLISQKNASIKKGRLPTVRGHKLQLHQLFSNLISNALKFSQEIPAIEITATPVNGQQVSSVGQLNSKISYWQITVQDNGIGFEQHFADKIFTIFQRLNPREKFEGTGIGLALCKKIVENHAGHITVNSVPGEGTAFTIYLPVTVS
jgi:PAS domain S-box-containing protein